MASIIRFDNWENSDGTQAGSIDASGNVTFDNDVSITGEFTSRGYRYVDTIYFTSDSTFTKASYPWLRAIRVKVQGAGGGGGSTDYCNSAGEAAASSGGGGGGYAESFITDIASLASSVTVTVGTGGAGATGGDSVTLNGAVGTDGGSSSFGSGTAYEVSGDGGTGGNRGYETGGFYTTSGKWGGSGTGDLVVPGEASEPTIHIGLAGTTSSHVVAAGSNGGDSMLGAGGRVSSTGSTSGQVTRDGGDGSGYGGGGSGGAAAAYTGTADGADGGAGSNGIVIVELYA